MHAIRSGDPIQATVADAQGRFAFEHVRPGRYRLVAEHQAYLDNDPGFSTDSAVELTIAAGTNLTDVSLRLTPQAVISGRVVDDDGDPWVHAHVGIRRVTWRDGRRKLEGMGGGAVDDEGRFRIPQLPPGKYYLSAEPSADWERRNTPTGRSPAQRLQPTWYPHAAEEEGALALILTAGQELSGIEIRLIRGTVHNITGVVTGVQALRPTLTTDLYAQPRVSATLLSGAAANSYPGDLRADGSFEILGVPSGVYDVKVLQGMMPIVGLGRARVRVRDQDVEGVSVMALAPRPLPGIVRIEGEALLPLSALSIRLDSLDDSIGLLPAHPQADGTFKFDRIASERYSVRIYTDTANPYYLKSIRCGTRESSDGTFTLSGADQTLELIVSARGARLTGMVKSDAVELEERRPDPAAKPKIILIPETPEDTEREYKTHLATPDQNGQFSMSPIAPGMYTLFAFENLPDGAWMEPEFRTEINGKGTILQFDDGDSLTVQIPVMLKSDIAHIMTRLGIYYFTRSRRLLNKGQRLPKTRC